MNHYDHNDLNRLFTDKVSELLAQGFQIHSGTMSGSQGEIAKVDLYKEDTLLRVWMARDYTCSSSYDFCICIRVGRWTKKLRLLWDDKVWERDLEVLSEIKFARITDDFFTTPEEGTAMAKKRLDRWLARNRNRSRDITNEATKAIALKYVRRQPRMKNCKLEDIQKVTRVNERTFTRVLPDLHGYEITARGKTFLLRPNKK